MCDISRDVLKSQDTNWNKFVEVGGWPKYMGSMKEVGELLEDVRGE